MIEKPTYEELERRIEALEREVAGHRTASGNQGGGKGQVQDVKGTLTMNRQIAHELNNTLGIILGCTELSLLLIDESSAAHSHLSQVLKATNRARDLVRQVLMP